MSLALAIGNAGGPAALRVRRTVAQARTLFLSAASMSFSNLPPGPASVIGSGSLTVMTGGATGAFAFFGFGGGVTTTLDPGLSTASTSACCFSVAGRVPARRSRRASRRVSRRLPRLRSRSRSSAVAPASGNTSCLSTLAPTRAGSAPILLESSSKTVYTFTLDGDPLPRQYGGDPPGIACGDPTGRGARRRRALAGQDRRRLRREPRPGPRGAAAARARGPGRGGAEPARPRRAVLPRRSRAALRDADRQRGVRHPGVRPAPHRRGPRVAARRHRGDGRART